MRGARPTETPRPRPTNARSGAPIGASRAGAPTPVPPGLPRPVRDGHRLIRRAPAVRGGHRRPRGLSCPRSGTSTLKAGDRPGQPSSWRMAAWSGRRRAATGWHGWTYAAGTRYKTSMIRGGPGWCVGARRAARARAVRGAARGRPGRPARRQPAAGGAAPTTCSTAGTTSSPSGPGWRRGCSGRCAPVRPGAYRRYSWVARAFLPRPGAGPGRAGARRRGGERGAGRRHGRTWPWPSSSPRRRRCGWPGRWSRRRRRRSCRSCVAGTGGSASYFAADGTEARGGPGGRRRPGPAARRRPLPRTPPLSAIADRSCPP